jgi:chromosome partitioning protein
MNTKIISIVNQKGGVGKTTTAVNLATALSVLDKRILVIDLDPQGNTSSGFGIRQQDRKNTIYQVLIGVFPLQDAVMQTNIPNLEVVTSNTNLSALSSLEKEYDFIIIDCPPSLSLLTINALVASNGVLIPMLCDFYSLEGLSHLLKTVERIEKTLNPHIRICGILFTMYDKRSRLTELVEADVRSHLGNLVFDTVIPRNVKLSEAPSHGKPAILYDYKCSGAVAYMRLTNELINRS